MYYGTSLLEYSLQLDKIFSLRLRENNKIILKGKNQVDENHMHKLHVKVSKR